MTGSIAASIRAALKEGSKNQAIKQFGARAVAQELRRVAAAAEKAKKAKIADTPNVQAMGSVQAKK